MRSFRIFWDTYCKDRHLKHSFTSGSTSSADGADEFWNTKAEQFSFQNKQKYISPKKFFYDYNPLPQVRSTECSRVGQMKSQGWDQLWDRQCMGSSVSVNTNRITEKHYAGMSFSLCIQISHLPLLLLSFTLRQSDGQLQLLLLLQRGFVSLRRHLRSREVRGDEGRNTGGVKLNTFINLIWNLRDVLI